MPVLGLGCGTPNRSVSFILRSLAPGPVALRNGQRRVPEFMNEYDEIFHLRTRIRSALENMVIKLGRRVCPRSLHYQQVKVP